MSEFLTHPFGPLYCERSRVLILGSFPSVKSREQQFFYGHPQNRFWRMLAAIYGEAAPETIEEKRLLVLSHGLALWDAVGRCSVAGSSDASIRDVEPVDIGIVLKIARIERVLCNGRLAGDLYHRHLEDVTRLPAIVLPSTSPANASCSFERLVSLWGRALLA